MNTPDLDAARRGAMAQNTKRMMAKRGFDVLLPDTARLYAPDSGSIHPHHFFDPPPLYGSTSTWLHRLRSGPCQASCVVFSRAGAYLETTDPSSAYIDESGRVRSGNTDVVPDPFVWTLESVLALLRRSQIPKKISAQYRNNFPFVFVFDATAAGTPSGAFVTGLVELMQEAVDGLNGACYRSIWILANPLPKHQSKQGRALASLHRAGQLEVFLPYELQYCILDLYDQPELTALDADEMQTVRGFAGGGDKLPILDPSDPVARYFGLVTNEIIKAEYGRMTEYRVCRSSAAFRSK